MKRIFVSFLLVFSFLMVSAQSRSKKADIEVIKSDPSYYWGESEVMDSQDEALENAYASLYSNIAKKCKASAIYVGKEEQSVQLVKIISTFSDRIRERASETPIKENSDDDEYSYLVYLPKTSFDTMCYEREKSIVRLANRGLKCENEECLQLEDALRAYYWGMMLCVAHPQGNNIKIDDEGEQVQAYQWFVDRIDGSDGILKSFTFNIQKDGVMKSKDDMLINLNVRSVLDGSPISNLKFDYHNGQKYIPTAVNDGKAIVTVGQLDKPMLNIKIEYEFKEESTVDPDVYKVLNTIKSNVKFKNNKHTIDLSAYIEKLIDNDKIDVGGKSEAPSTELEKQWRSIDEKFNVKDEKYLAIMQEIEKGLREKNYESIKRHFTAEGFGMLDTLLQYGRITVVGKQDYDFIKFGEQVICRDINMLFEFRNNSFNRDVVFRFDHQTSKVTSIAFRLSSVTEKDILLKNRWSQEARVVLINFLEDYQTAYALKRLDYLESIYSDDALIIVGHVVKRTEIQDRAQFNLSENDVKLMQYDKNTYFNNLTRTFKSQEYINIRFAETDFTCVQSANREIFGVRLLQEYYSSTYGDIGYLFLLVDLTNSTPLIHVRAWQPDEVDLEKLMTTKQIRM